MNDRGASESAGDEEEVLVQQAMRAPRARNSGLRVFDQAAFAEDSWRANNRLTVTYGMRYQFRRRR